MFDILPLPKASNDDSSAPSGEAGENDAGATPDDAGGVAAEGGAAADSTAATAASFHTGSPLFTGLRFRLRPPMMGRGGPPPLMGPPFAGANFGGRGPRFPGQRPHMAFFQGGPHPRHFGGPRPFSSRSNNF